MTIIDAVTDKKLLGQWFKASSWRAWITFLTALFGLPLSEEQQATYQRHTGRTRAAAKQAREGWLVVGRRGGKSIVAALVAVFLACFRDYRPYLAPGELATVMVIAADRRQARIIFRYIEAFVDEVPMLARLVAHRTKESLELSNRVIIEIHTCSFKTTRGYTLAAVVADEVAFWLDESSSNPATEIINGLRPGLLTVPNSLMLCISSPYSRTGIFWQSYAKHYGRENEQVLVWQADTRSMNPTVDQQLIEQAYEQDEASARAEYGAEFRRDIETFVSVESIDRCIVSGCLEWPPAQGLSYRAFVDPAGGSGGDSMTLAIGHQSQGRIILAALRERRPPFSPESVVDEFCSLLKSYRVSQVTGDRFAGEWPRERFRKQGITYQLAEKNKSELYLNLLPKLNSGRVELLDHKKLKNQLTGLERRTARGGRDSIDHAPNAHDDLANVLAGVVLLCEKASGGVWWTSDIDMARFHQLQLQRYLDGGSRSESIYQQSLQKLLGGS